MSTPYGHFWVIVLMTGGAVIMANLTAKHSVVPQSQISVSTPKGEPTRKSDEQKSASIQPARIESPSTPITPASSSSLSPPPSEQQNFEGPREYKSIDDDIALAFDQATAIAMRSQAAASVEASPAEKAATDEAPPLTTRVISPSPEIYDAQPGTMLAAVRADAITTTNLNMREGPSPKYVLVETLATNVTVRVLEREGDWVHVQSVPSGRQGWVNGKFLALKTSP